MGSMFRLTHCCDVSVRVRPRWFRDPIREDSPSKFGLARVVARGVRFRAPLRVAVTWRRILRDSRHGSRDTPTPKSGEPGTGLQVGLFPQIATRPRGTLPRHYMNRRFDEAANAARRAAQGNPGFSIMHMPLAPSLAAQGRVTEANAAAARVLALQPDFTIDKHCADIAVLATLAVPLPKPAAPRDCRNHAPSQPRLLAGKEQV